jgi:hypothetical protein
MTTAQDEKEFIERYEWAAFRGRIDSVLWKDWNPLKVHQGDDEHASPCDTYNGCLAEIKHMLQRGTDVEELIRFLFGFEYETSHTVEETIEQALTDCVPPDDYNRLKPIAAKLLLNHFKRFRSDGWPYCPNCEEEELYSYVMLRWNGQGERPTVSECIKGGMKCYRCNWDCPPPEKAIAALDTPDAGSGQAQR